MTVLIEGFSDFKLERKECESAVRLGLMDNMFGGAQVLRQRTVS